MRSALAFLVPALAAAGSVEILRDRWGVPHIYAEAAADGFFGVGYAAAEDRILQMDLFRRRAQGRLAEVFGARYVDSDRRFRMAGVAPYCEEAERRMPEEQREYMRSYAAGVNLYIARNAERVSKRFAPLGEAPAAWKPSDSICAWMGMTELFDRLVDEAAVQSYHEFQQLLRQSSSEDAAARQRMVVIDDAAAVVPRSEMQRNPAAFAELEAQPRTPGYWFRSMPDDMLRFSHAWAVDGSRSVTGSPLLESDPQTPVNNPAIWWEFHIDAGRYHARGITVAGSPAVFIGFNPGIAWGASALGAAPLATFIEKESEDETGYLYQGRQEEFQRRAETILVKGGEPVRLEALRTRHGFVVTPLIRTSVPDEIYVSHHAMIEQRGTSLRAMFDMMAARGVETFKEALEHYYSPGLHLVWAQRDGHIGYQTLVHVPRTRRSIRMALEGWTGEDEIRGRLELYELPNMQNPETRFISHANNLPVGSWYPYDLGIGTGGIGHTTRSLRLIELLGGSQRFSVDSFESVVHRDGVNPAVALLFPVAQRLAAEPPLSSDAAVGRVLDQLKGWDLRYRATEPTYPAAMALADASLLSYRGLPLGSKLGGGEGGLTHLARRIGEQYGAPSSGAPKDADVRAYLTRWLQTTAANLTRNGALAPVNGVSQATVTMPYQQNGPLGFPALDSKLELKSPPLMNTQGGTIWSQHGNSYTQIVDLSDLDNSRALLPPGVTEDPESPFWANQMDLWAQGTTRPAPLSRGKVEPLIVSRQTLETGN